MAILLSLNSKSKLITDYTQFIIAHWVKRTKKFPTDLYGEISKYYQVIAVFGDINYKPKHIFQIIRMAESAERYDEMAQLMIIYLQCVEYDNIDYGTYMRRNNTYIGQKRDFVLLNYEARNLMKVAFENVIKSRNDSCKKLVDDQNNEMTINKKYFEIMKLEVLNIYMTVMNVLEHIVIPKCKYLIDEECKKVDGELSTGVYNELLFCQSLCANYCRCLCEIFTDNISYKQKCEYMFHQAIKYSNEKINDILQPTLLNLMLNYSLYKHDVCGDTESALAISKDTFDSALDALDRTESNYQDVTLILQIIRDNMVLWTTQDQN